MPAVVPRLRDKSGVSEGWFCSGVLGFLVVSVCSQGFGLRMGFIAGVTDNVNNYFYFFQAATRIAQSFARYGGIEAANLMGFTEPKTPLKLSEFR